MRGSPIVIIPTFQYPKSKMVYDIIIIGGGPAGLTAGLYASRGGLKTLLLEKVAPGGLVTTTEKVENYPGFPEGVNGYDLAALMEKQARKFGLEIATAEVTGLIPPSVNSASRSPLPYDIKTPSQEYQGRTVIIATGTIARNLNVPNEDKFKGRGISYCATCDAPFFKNKEIIVVGGGDAALEESLFLTRFVKKISLVHRRDKLRAAKILQERASNHPKINFVWNSAIEKIIGHDKIEKVVIKNLLDNSTKEIPADGIFVFIGFIPNTDFLSAKGGSASGGKGVVELDETGYIITNEKLVTSRTGIFACGDVIAKNVRQIINACGEGAVAALNAQHYLESLG